MSRSSHRPALVATLPFADDTLFVPESAPIESQSSTAATPVNLWAGLRPHLGLFSLLCIATFFEGFDTKLTSFVQPVVRETFSSSAAEVGVSVGISGLGMVAAFAVILLADVVGRRPVFLGGLFAYAFFTLATAFAPNLATFTVLQFFGRGAMVVELFLAYVILSEEMPPEIRGRVNGLFASTAAIGAALPAGLLAPLEALGIGWRGLFVIGALPLLFFPLYLKRIKETRAFLERPPGGSRYGEDFLRIARSLWHSNDRARLIRVTCIWFAINFWSGTALYFFTTYVYDDHGWTPADLVWLPPGTISIGVAGYVLSGFIMDRFGRRTAATLYLAAAFLASAFCYRSTHAAAIYLGYFLMVGLSGIWTIVTTWTTELFPTESRATALALANNLFGRLGIVLGPIVGGILSDRLGSSGLAITALSCVTLLAIPFVWSLPETNAARLLETARSE